MIKRMLLGFLLTCLNAFAFAAEDFTLWDSQTFAAPYPDNIVATSGKINNNNGLNSVKVNVVYEALTPDRATNAASYKIVAVIQEEVATGIWTPVCYAFTGINDTTHAPLRTIVLTPTLVIDPGVDNVIWYQGASKAMISTCDGQLPASFRVSLMLETYGADDLTSVTVSAHGRKFNR